MNAPIKPPKIAPTVVHMFAGSGGCTLGFQRAGFRSLGSFDFDPAACRDLVRLTGGPAFCRDLAKLEPGDMNRDTGGVCPDVVVMSAPCKSFSGCMPAARAGEAHYVDMSQLAIRGMFLALEAWGKAKPKIILLENVPRIQTRGASLLAQIVALLQRYGYATDQRTHDCGELGGLAQHRERFLLVARHMETCPDFLRVPEPQRVRSVAEVLFDTLPSPAADHGDEMHRLPLLSAMNWLRLAAIRAGKDWRDLPSEIRLGGERVDPGVGFGGKNTHSGIMGVESQAEPAHTVTGNARVQANRGAVADPRVGWDEGLHSGRPDSWGVVDPAKPSLTVRGRQHVQSSRASVADPRLAFRAMRQNGGMGVEDGEAPAHAVLGEGTVRNTRASVADPRIVCEPRSGAYGMLDGSEPAATVVGHHKHDNSPGSVADPRLSHEPRRGTMGVLDPDAPAPTVRGHHSMRQAASAVVDARGWPVPTHELVIEDGAFVLYGPAIDLESKRPCLLVIRAPDGTWHRPMTDRELACLQGFPLDCQLEGPSSSSKAKTGRREHIGNAIPPPTAEAIAREVKHTLEVSAAGSFRLLASGLVWVSPEQGAIAA